MPGWEQAEHQTGHDRDGYGKGENRPVDAHRSPAGADARDVARIEREQRSNADGAEHEAECAARERQHDALGEQLADDTRAARAERRADRNLVPADVGAHEQQVGDVGTRNQQDEADGPGQDQERRSDVADDDVLQRLNGEINLRIQDVGKQLSELVRCGLQLCIRAFEPDAGFEAGRGGEKVPLHPAVGIDLERQPGVG